MSAETNALDSFLRIFFAFAIPGGFGLVILGILADKIRDFYWSYRNREAIALGEEPLPEHLLLPGSVDLRSNKGIRSLEKEGPEPNFNRLYEGRINEP